MQLPTQLYTAAVRFRQMQLQYSIDIWLNRKIYAGLCLMMSKMALFLLFFLLLWIHVTALHSKRNDTSAAKLILWSELPRKGTKPRGIVAPLFLYLKQKLIGVNTLYTGVHISDIRASVTWNFMLWSGWWRSENPSDTVKTNWFCHHDTKWHPQFSSREWSLFLHVRPWLNL